MTRKTIGIDMRGLTQGMQTGVGQYARGLLQAIWKQDSPHTYIAFDNQWGAAAVPSWIDQTKVRVVKMRYPNKALSLSISLTQRPQIDRLMTKERGALDYFFSPNINITGLSQQTKHILTIHDLSFEHHPQHFSWKSRMKHKAARPKARCQTAHKIITPSEYTKRDLERTFGIEQEKIHVVSPGINAAQPVPQTVVSQTKETYALPGSFILFLGTVEPRKNIISLIEAYSSLNNTDVQLIIAGAQGWKNVDILSAIDDTPGVRYIGYVTEEEKKALYTLASLFVYPSVYEGFGFPVLEAMAAGTPVVTSHHSSLSEVAGNAAYYVNPRNVSEIAQGLRLLLDDETLAQQYRQKGLERVQQFQWEDAAKQWLSLL